MGGESGGRRRPTRSRPGARPRPEGGAGWAAAGIMLLVAIAGGFLLGLTGRAGKPPRGDVLRGEWAAAWQRAYERSLPLRDPAVRLWGALRYGLFGEGRPGALVGEEGWLFTTEEFAAPPDEAAAIDAAADTVAAVRDRLRVRGTGLIVALVPAKARIYPDRLGRYRFPADAAARYERFRRALLARGIAAPDLAAPLREARALGEVFLRTDTHWSPLGARAAAAALAPSGRRELAGRGVPPTAYRTWPAGSRAWRGDLLGFLPAGLPPDTVAEYRTGEEHPARLGLFAAVRIPVTLVGTSYSAGGLWNFEGALKEQLGADVLNAAEEGRGPLVPMREWLDGETARDHPPALVVWEIPERYIAGLGAP